MNRSKAGTKVWHIPSPINFLSRTRSPYGDRHAENSAYRGAIAKGQNTSADFDQDHAVNAGSWMNRSAEGWQSYFIHTMVDGSEHEMDVVLLRTTVLCSLSSENSFISFLLS